MKFVGKDERCRIVPSVFLRSSEWKNAAVCCVDAHSINGNINIGWPSSIQARNRAEERKDKFSGEWNRASAFGSFPSTDTRYECVAISASKLRHFKK